jgi:two-component system, OmpR family, phosphate regulon sensor histidine kinase PhoR
MRDQGLRMSRLIDDLLSLSRIEMKAHLAPEQRVDLSGIVKEIVNSLSQLAGERETRLQVTLPESPALVAGDRDELLRMLENLIENAVKYGHRGGQVHVSLVLGEADLTLLVADDGPGIAPEHLPRLTERFYRVNTSASREAGGTGLGLAIVKHIVLRHRGKFSIESTLGQGTRMEVQLPQWSS